MNILKSGILEEHFIRLQPYVAYIVYDKIQDSMFIWIKCLTFITCFIFQHPPSTHTFSFSTCMLILSYCSYCLKLYGLGVYFFPATFHPG